MPMNPRLLRPTASGFNPRRISGISLWYDAAAFNTVQIDTGVSVWRDKSGLGRDATQLIGNEQPEYRFGERNGRNVVRFDGSNDQMSFANASVSTLFVVTKVATPDKSLAAVIGGIPGAPARADNGLRRNNTQSGYNFPGNIDDFTGGVGTSQFFINGASGSTVATDVWHIVSALRNTTPIEYNRLGFTFANREYSGDVGEIIAYDRLVTSTERKQVESYLGKKWGIAVT